MVAIPTMVSDEKRYKGGRPKKTVDEVLDLKDLHREWDANHELRARLREGEGLLRPGQAEDIPSTLENLPILQPLLTRMSLTETRPLPAVETLRDEVEALLQKNKRGGAPENEPDVVAISWRIRKLVGFVKMKVRRREVSSVPLLHWFVACI